MDHHEQRITGVFFEETTINLGTGHTQKSERVKNFCRADQLDNERIKLAYLGLEGLPTGIVIELPIDEFLKRFTLEPNFKIKNENERVVDKHCALAEKHRARKEFNSAEWEYSKALKIDQENLRANFGIGTLYMEMGEPGKAKEVFKKLTQIDAIFEPSGTGGLPYLTRSRALLARALINTKRSRASGRSGLRAKQFASALMQSHHWPCS